MIGSLYAYDPGADLTFTYKNLMNTYIQKTKKESEQKEMNAGILAGIALQILSGGTLGYETVLGSSAMLCCLAYGRV